jgi:hypothetical protein
LLFARLSFTTSPPPGKDMAPLEIGGYFVIDFEGPWFPADATFIGFFSVQNH